MISKQIAELKSRLQCQLTMLTTELDKKQKMIERLIDQHDWNKHAWCDRGDGRLDEVDNNLVHFQLRRMMNTKAGRCQLAQDGGVMLGDNLFLRFTVDEETLASLLQD